MTAAEPAAAEPAARSVLRRAEAAARRAGHGNLGFLSEAAGFLPAAPPILALPSSHAAWDEVAAALPELYRTMALRRAVEGLPLLSAAVRALDDRYLLRAACILGIVAHAYVRVDPRSSPALPAPIREPWETVSRRLGRPGPMLSYIDLIAYNWRVDPGGRRVGTEQLRVEDLRLLVPTVDNPEERVFYLTQTEILARSAPVVAAVVRAQEAALRADVPALKAELADIADRLREVTHRALPKISPLSGSPTYVDPVVWAKTVAPLAVPLEPGVQGPSGTSSPLFPLLDAFFGRMEHTSLLGREAMQLRRAYPPTWRAFLRAVQAVSVDAAVEAAGDAGLRTLFDDALRAYAGEDGFLGRHRVKVYGYLETAFKVGREVTIGGFSGLFRDRTWDEVDDQLEQARSERPGQAAGTPAGGWHDLPVRSASLLGASSSAGSASGGACHVVLDARGAGIRHQPGDRLEVLPEHAAATVEQALIALDAHGGERIRLDDAWREAVRARSGLAAATVLPLRTLLRFGRLSRVLAGEGFDPAALWAAGDAGATLCRLVLPERPRLYSIASGRDVGRDDGVGEVELLAGQVPVTTPASHAASAGPAGTASAFLGRLGLRGGGAGARVTVRVAPAPSFRLPEDPGVPIILFAGGTGIAPFRSFLAQRRQQPGAGPAWLLASVRTAADLPFAQELAELVSLGGLRLDVVCTREDATVTASADGGALHAGPGRRGRIDALMLRPGNAGALRHHLRSREEGGSGAVFYVCGSAGFAGTVLRALEAVGQQLAPPGRPAEPLTSRLTGEHRLLQEVHDRAVPSPRPLPEHDLSEVALHNDDAHGWWLVIHGWVHDVTGFLAAHPGGAGTLRAYAGMDATSAYRKVGHHRRQEQEALLRGLRIGRVRKLDLSSDQATGKDAPATPAAVHRCWVGFLQLVVEMENALRHDYASRGREATGGERGATSSAYRLQLLVDIHRRFLHGYLDDLLGPQLAALWKTTATAARVTQVPAGRGHPEEMSPQLERLRTGAEADAAARRLQEVEAVVREPGAALAEVWRATASWEAESALLLQQAKQVVRAGVQRFEAQGRGALDEPLLLLELAACIPELVRGFYRRVGPAEEAVLAGAARRGAGSP